jgi:hypothetical protein
VRIAIALAEGSFTLRFYEKAALDARLARFLGLLIFIVPQGQHITFGLCRYPSP